MVQFDRIKTFLHTESGAVTVDWVMMTAFVVGLVLAVMTSLGGASLDYSEVIASGMQSRGIPTY